MTVVNPATAGSGSARCVCLEVATLISAADISPRVGSAGPVEAAFEVRLDAPSGVETTVDYATVDGTAVAGSDYEPASGTLRFPPNTTSLSVTVIVLPGADAAPAQAFGLALSGPVNARLATTMAIATIEYDDDAVPAPELTGLTPGTVGIGAPARVLTLHGQRFHPTSTVSVSGRGVVVVSTQYVDQATLRVSLNAWATAEAGPRDVTVTTPGSGSSTCAGCLRVTPAPAATGAAPALATGATERVITVSGTGFAPGAKPVFVGGSGVGVRSTEYVSSAALRVTVSVAQTATVGDYDIKVTNLDGGTTMCLDCYRVLAGPTVVAMTPPLVLRGSTLPVVITGTGFVNGVTVQGPAGVRFTNAIAVDSTTITAVISVELTRGRGVDLPITVVNPASAGWGQGTGRCLGISV